MMHFASHISGIAASALSMLQEAVPGAAAAPVRGMNLNSPVWGYALMAVLGGCIIGISLLPSKRGHQD